MKNRQFNELKKFEIEKICNLLECDTEDIERCYEIAEKIYNNSDSTYGSVLKILQEGTNVREAALIGIFCGQLIGFYNAESKIEEEIKEKLFNAFKNNRNNR